MRSDQHTFVVLAYQESPYLDACLQSLLRQTVKSQILICTSTPCAHIETLAITYNLPLLVNPVRGGGIAADWNFAYQTASTDYVTLAHQDDTYGEYYTQALVDSLSRTPDSLIAFTDYAEIFDGKHHSVTTLLVVKRLLLMPLWLIGQTNRPFWKRSILLFGNPVCCPSVCFNKGRIGPFTFEKSYKVNLDWDAWRRLALYKGSFVYIPRLLTTHRIHPDAETTKTLQSTVRLREDELILRQVWGNRLGNVVSWFYSFGYKTYKRVLD